MRQDRRSVPTIRSISLSTGRRLERKETARARAYLTTTLCILTDEFLGSSQGKARETTTCWIFSCRSSRWWYLELSSRVRYPGTLVDLPIGGPRHSLMYLLWWHYFFFGSVIPISVTPLVCAINRLFASLLEFFFHLLLLFPKLAGSGAAC
ncbi:hypothetical protein HDV57DRAFT_215436 [Trichoderma longibrachiatum]